MVAEELVKDSYITEQKQTGGLVDKYRLSHRYAGTISPNPNYPTNAMPIEELLTFRRGYGIMSGSAVTITIRQQPAQVGEEPVAYQSRNEQVATFPKVLQEKAIWAYTVVRRSDTSSTSGSLMEELKELLRQQTQEWVEVYPGYKVTPSEYERRFKGVALDNFRKVLPLELFKTYVHTMGSIEGWGIEPPDRYKGKD
jgi:hypothetical protein